jgi:hypothetical protein
MKYLGTGTDCLAGPVARLSSEGAANQESLTAIRNEN